MPKEEILEVAKWQLKEEVHFDLEKSVWDWQVVREHIDEDGAKKNEVMLILAKLETIAKYLSIANGCSLIPIGITSSPFNYSSVLRCSKESVPIQAILDIGYLDTALCIYKDNKLTFIRKLPFSSEKITQSLTGTLTTDKGKLEISSQEAEGIRDAFGIPQDEALVLKDNIQAIQLIWLMRPILEGLVRELKRSFDYFVASLKENSPAALYITGGGANLKNLDKYLSKELNIRVAKLPLPCCVHSPTVTKERLDNDQNQILSAVGAVLANREGVNLLPLEVKAQKVEFIQNVSLRLITFTLGAILLVSLSMIRFQLHDYKNRLRNAQIHLETIKGVVALKEKMGLREDLIDKIHKDKVPAAGLLKLISTLVPGSITLDELILDQHGHRLNLKGEVSASEGIAGSALTRLMEKIETSPFFSEVNLLSSQQVESGQRFELQCDLAH